MKVVIIGGGITGLAAAHALAGRAEVTVVEAASRVGGKLRTSPVGGTGPAAELEVDEGAESFLARVPDGTRLARQVGLGHDIVHPATTSASVIVGGRPRPMPPGTVLGVPTDAVGLIRSRVLSPAGLARLAADLVLPRGERDEDPSVGDYVGARLGHQLVERLVDPMLGGVYGGRADRLSLRATVPQLVPIVAEDRSLLLGARRVRARTAPPAAASTPVFASVRGGLGRFAATVASASGATIRTGVTARALAPAGPGWRVEVTTNGPAPAGGVTETLDADAVVIAVPAPAARRLLEPLAPRAATALVGIPYASIAIVTLVYRDVAPPPGSGFLVPPTENAMIKAATFLSAKWPETVAGTGLTVVRASVGRAGDEADLRRGDVELAGVAAAEVAALTRAAGRRGGGGAGLSARPIASRVSRWGGALPQYLPGHLERVANARAALPAGILLAGAGYDGVGIPACIRSGEAAAEGALEAALAAAR
jgi:protoporphyrinogen/coproporphyrinogen III oxidase